MPFFSVLAIFLHKFRKCSFFSNRSVGRVEGSRGEGCTRCASQCGGTACPAYLFGLSVRGRLRVGNGEGGGSVLN